MKIKLRRKGFKGEGREEEKGYDKRKDVKKTKVDERIEMTRQQSLYITTFQPC